MEDGCRCLQCKQDVGWSEAQTGCPSTGFLEDGLWLICRTFCFLDPFSSYYCTQRVSQVALVVRIYLPMQETQGTRVRSLGQGRSPGGGHDNPLQYSCLGNPRDRGAWWATVHGVAELDVTEWLSTVLYLEPQGENQVEMKSLGFILEKSQHLKGSCIQMKCGQ